MTSDVQWEEEWFSLGAAEKTPDLFLEIRKLQAMVHAQSEEIKALKSSQDRIEPLLEELKALKSASHDRIEPLLEELKRVKERELNLALRCHQPVPFFDARSIVRLVGPGVKGVAVAAAGTAVAVAKTDL
jgi:hypothetical protein